MMNPGHSARVFRFSFCVLVVLATTVAIRADDGDDVVVPSERRRDLPVLISAQPPAVQQAWEAVTRAIAENEKLKPPRPDPYIARAEIWSLIKNYDAALRDYARALELSESAGLSQSRQTSLLRRIGETVDRYDRIPRPSIAGRAVVHYGKGVHAFRRKDYTQAVRHLDNSIQLEPRNCIYWYFRGLAWRLAGNQRRARHDVLIGAQLEARMDILGELRDAVAEHLESVQGADRQWLERFRTGDPSQRILEE